MEIPFDKQARTDSDWFGVDEDDQSTTLRRQVSSGCRRVAKSAEGLRTVTDDFGNVGPVRGSHTVDHQCLATALQPEWKAEGSEARYFHRFVSMAEKGLFSFDIGSYLRPVIT